MIEVRRGGRVESRHRISAALVDAQGQLLAWLGDPEFFTFFRSTAKPFQALPLVADGVTQAFGFTDAELAVCCASHSGEPDHVETVRALLKKTGCSEHDLECGAHWPLHKPSADALIRECRAPSPIHNNCSGKHAGMLAWARHRGVNPKGYRCADHPVQARVCCELGTWTNSTCEALPRGTDGCGVVSFASPLNIIAGAYAQLMAAARRDPEGPAGVVTAAMTREPYFAAGTGRLSTRLMEVTGGRLLAKNGADGVFAVGDHERGWGLALKVEDGRDRAVGPAVVESLAQIELLKPDQLLVLDQHHVGTVENTVGEIVGEVRAEFRIQRVE
ncbi:MAG: asparaginase [Gemmatimonadota bacterium]|nr:MAG: asparaginase [Gemmatimonadota bacterium]